MNLFPTIVVDNFFDDPDYVLGLAKTVEYTDPSPTNHPGVVSKKKIQEIDNRLFNTIVQKIFGYFWDLRNPLKYMVDIEFQKIDSLGEGVIHVDSAGALAAGIIYLDKNAPRDTGTSFYRLLDDRYEIKQEFLDSIAKDHAGDTVDGIDQIRRDHHSRFEETMRVQNQYNRLVFYSGDVWHTATSYQNQTRNTLRFFVSEVLSNHQNFPLLR